jgi:GT2 family glycosyltransferase
LHYRNWPAVAETLRALAGQTRAPDHVLLVDNASADGSVAALKAAFPALAVLELDRNDGYAAGMNAGAGRMPDDIDFLLLLTHECVLAPDALDNLVLTLREDPGCAIAGPLLGLRSAPDTVWSAGGRLAGWIGQPRHIRWPARISGWRDRPPVEVDWLDGAALLVRADAFRRVGGLDETYFLYYEELDLCLRVRRAGYTLRCVPAAAAWQEPGNASPYLDARNFPRVLRRNGRTGAALIAALSHLAAGIRDLAVARNRPLARARLVGLVHGRNGRLDRTLAATRTPTATRTLTATRRGSGTQPSQLR